MKLEVPGSLDRLVNELQNKYDRPLPAADPFLTNAYNELMAGVTDVKDLGSGVIGGIECDYFAFRTKEVDWQIWIAQGASPHPCRYVITSTQSTTDRSTASSFGTGKPAGRSPRRTSRSGRRPERGEFELDELRTMKDAGDLSSHFILGGK